MGLLPPIITIQLLKPEDLNAQFGSIVRRYRDGGLIAYRDARYFTNDMLNLFERIERLRLFVNNDGAKKVLVHFTKKLGNLNIDDSNCSSTEAAFQKSIA